MEQSKISSERISRRSFLQMAAVTTTGAAMGAVTLAACGSTGAGTGAAGTVTIQFWDWFVSQAPWVDNEIKLFEQANPTIKIKKTTNATSTYDNLFNLAVRANNVPDVFMITTTATPLNAQVQKGWLMPVDKWANDAWKNRFPAGTFHEGNNMFGGKIYSAPLSGSAPWLQLYINNAVFKQAGLTNADGSVMLPKTWDDVASFSDTIVKKSNGSVYGLGFGNSGGPVLLPWWMELFIRGAGTPGGAYGMDMRVGKYTYASDPNYLNFLNLIMSWKQKNYFYPNSASISDEIARAYFERGKFGMTVGGVWNQGEWSDHKFTDYTLTTLLGPDSPPKGYFYVTPGGTLYAISAKTKYPDQTWAWFNWLYSPEAGKRWVQMGEDLSVYPQNDDPKLVTFKPFSAYVGLHNLAINGPDVGVRNPNTSQVVVNPVKPNIEDVMTGIYTGQIKDIEGALVSLQQRMQKAQDDGVAQAIQKGIKVSPSDWVFSDWDITRPYLTKPGQH